MVKTRRRNNVLMMIADRDRRVGHSSLDVASEQVFG